MNFTIKYKGKELKGTIPDTWQELKVKHFVGLEQGLSGLEVVALLSGIDKEALENTRADLTPIIEKALQIFNTKPPEFSKAEKTEIVIKGVLLKFPKTLDFTMYGQKIMIRSLIASNERIEKIIPDAFAIYAQPQIDGKFDSERLPYFKDIINELPIIKVFPYVLFFFRKLKGLKKHFNAI